MSTSTNDKAAVGASCTKEIVYATWNVELNVDCPKCEEYFNAIDTPDFWDGRSSLQPCMNGKYYEQARDLEITCPNCDHEFKVTCEY